MLHCIVIGACAVQFSHYVPLYRNTQHYTTLNCSIKTRLCAGGTERLYITSSFRFYRTITLNFHALAHYIPHQIVLAFIELSFVSANLELVFLTLKNFFSM